MSHSGGTVRLLTQFIARLVPGRTKPAPRRRENGVSCTRPPAELWRNKVGPWAAWRGRDDPFKQRPYLVEKCNVVRVVVLNRVHRHLNRVGFRRTLHDANATPFVNLDKPGRTVAASTCQNNANDRRTEHFRRADERPIRRRAGEVDLGSLIQAQPAAIPHYRMRA